MEMKLIPHATSVKILDAAEASFAEHGFAATSLRDITTKAGVNLASVNYHFGSKEALLASVLKRRFGPVNEARLALLTHLEADSAGDPTVEGLVHALLAPVFQQKREWDEQGTKFLQLIGRLHGVPHTLARSIMKTQFAEVFERFVPAFQRALPHLETEEVVLRSFFMLSALINTMTWSGDDMFGTGQPCGADALLDALVQFGVAGMAAPSRQLAPVSR
jgi:AcrR family transcriptional regulator